MSIETISFLLIVWASAGAITFVFLYGVVAPWYSSREGRHMMALTLGLAALGTVSVLRRAIGEWSLYDETVMSIYALIGWELWRRVWLLITAQRDGDERGDQ